MVTSPSEGVFSSSTIFMLDGTSTAAPATGLLPPQVARSDHNITVLGALAIRFEVVVCAVVSTTGLLLMAGGVTGAPLVCTALTTTGLVAEGVGTTLAAAAAGNVMTAAPTELADSTFVSVLLELELIATGPLAPATTVPGGPTVMGLAVTVLLSPPPDKPASVLFRGSAVLLPLPALLLLPSPPPPPQAVIKTNNNTAMIGDGLQIFRRVIRERPVVEVTC